MSGEEKATFQPNRDLVMLVEQLAAGVRAGRITSIAAVTIGPLGDMQWPGVGMQVPEMLIGAELMRSDMLAAVRGHRGRVIRPGG